MRDSFQPMNGRWLTARHPSQRPVKGAAFSRGGGTLVRDGTWLMGGIYPRAKPGQGSTQPTRCTHLRGGSKQRGCHVTDRRN